MTQDLCRACGHTRQEHDADGCHGIAEGGYPDDGSHNAEVSWDGPCECSAFVATYAGGIGWVEAVRTAAMEARMDQVIGKAWSVEQMAARLLPDAAREIADKMRAAGLLFTAGWVERQFVATNMGGQDLHGECGQKGCTNVGAYSFTWPGNDEALVCEQHVGKVRAIAEALALRLQVIPLRATQQQEGA